MAGKNKWRFRLPENWRFRLLLLVALIAGLLLASIKWEKNSRFEQHPRVAPVAARLLTGLGEALSIAALIGLLVDEGIKRRLLKEFGEGISIHIIGRHLPMVLREHLHNYLMLDFVRYNWEVTYIINVLAHNPEYVELRTESVYEIENGSPVKRSYPLAFEVERSWCPHIGETRITLVKAHDQKTGTDIFEYHHGDPRLITKIEDDYVKLQPDKNMKIVMPGCEPGSQHRFRFELESIEYYRNSFFTPFDALQPVVPDTTVTVIYEKDTLKVGLYLTFSDLSEATNPVDEQPTFTKWTINKPFLPGQGFIVRWNPQKGIGGTAGSPGAFTHPLPER